MTILLHSGNVWEALTTEIIFFQNVESLRHLVIGESLDKPHSMIVIKKLGFVFHKTMTEL
jgi:hypothetical protein